MKLIIDVTRATVVISTRTEFLITADYAVNTSAARRSFLNLRLIYDTLRVTAINVARDL